MTHVGSDIEHRQTAEEAMEESTTQGNRPSELSAKITQGCLIFVLAIVAIIGCCSIFILPSEEERDAERRSWRVAARQALDGSAIEAAMVSFEAYSGTLDVTLNRSTTQSWEQVSCDHQRAALLELFKRWKLRYGPTAHTVTLRSYTGREIGLIKRTVTSGFRFHCG